VARQTGVALHKRLGLEAVCDADDVLANAGCNRQRGDARRYLGFAFQISPPCFLSAADGALPGTAADVKKAPEGAFIVSGVASLHI